MRRIPSVRSIYRDIQYKESATRLSMLVREEGLDPCGDRAYFYFKPIIPRCPCFLRLETNLPPGSLRATPPGSTLPVRFQSPGDHTRQRALSRAGGVASCH